MNFQEFSLYTVQNCALYTSIPFFKQVVFNDEDKSDIIGLEDIGMAIVKRCDGLPLAVKVVGGLLLSRSRRKRCLGGHS